MDFWVVTFAPDDRTFYTTLATGGTTYLVRGDLRARTVTTLHQNVEGPSLPPDGTRIAYKKRVKGLPKDTPWRLSVPDLRTMRETPLAESRSVDDQAVRRDDHTLVYALPGDYGRTCTRSRRTVWESRGASAPRPFPRPTSSDPGCDTGCVRTLEDLRASATSRAPYRSVKVEAELDEPLSRWLWLVKTVLLIPHHLVLTALWPLFAAASVVAFFTILFTGRYPRILFAFTTGVLRWSWRVGYYYFGALGTDRYPPFSLGAVPGYPARLEIAHPERLSRGLVLVKSWLLLLPHYLFLALVPLALRLAEWWGGLIWLLAVIAAVVSSLVGPGTMLLFTGRYPRHMFDTIVGVDRWILRVAAYAALMTDEYPPLRFDRGGTEAGRETEADRP